MYEVTHSILHYYKRSDLKQKGFYSAFINFNIFFQLKYMSTANRGAMGFAVITSSYKFSRNCSFII